LTTPNPEEFLRLVDLKDLASVRLVRGVLEGHVQRLQAEVSQLTQLSKSLAEHEQTLR
jgi:hypothetical protein